VRELKLLGQQLRETSQQGDWGLESDLERDFIAAIPGSAALTVLCGKGPDVAIVAIGAEGNLPILRVVRGSGARVLVQDIEHFAQLLIQVGLPAALDGVWGNATHIESRLRMLRLLLPRSQALTLQQFANRIGVEPLGVGRLAERMAHIQMQNQG